MLARPVQGVDVKEKTVSASPSGGLSSELKNALTSSNPFVVVKLIASTHLRSP